MLSKCLHYIFLIVLFVLLPAKCIAQNSTTDRAVDTFKLKLLHDYVNWTYNYASQKEFDSSNVYSKRALNLAKELNNKNLIGFAKNNMASNLFFQANTEKAKEIYSENTSDISINDSLRRRAYFGLFNIAYYKKEYKESVSYLVALEQLVKTIGIKNEEDSLDISGVNIGLGDVHKQLKEFDKAHRYYNQASQYMKNKNSDSYIVYYSAELFEEENKIREAINETKKALTLVSQGPEGKVYRPTYYLKLSNLYLKIKKPDSANYFGKLGVKDNDDCQLDLLNMAIGDSYHVNKDYQIASNYYQEAFNEAVSKDTELKIHAKLRENYTKLGNYKKALEENRLFLKLEDSINKLRVDQEIAEITEKYESSKKQLEIDRLELENVKQITLIDKQRSKIIYGSTVLGLSLIILALGSFYYMQQKKQKHQLFVRNLQLAKQLNQNNKQKKDKHNSRAKINDLQLEKIRLVIDDLIEEDFYLDPEMTLNKLSKLVNTNTSYLSKIINANYNKTFSNFLNELRISYTLKKFESDASFHKLTIDHIAEKSGFASSSTFYSAFKKFTGLTPSYYIKKRLARKHTLAEL